MCVHSSITPFMKLIDSLCKDGRWHSAASVLLPCALYPPRALRRQKKWPCKNSFTSLNNETFSLAYSYSINDVTLLHPSVKCLWLWKLPAEAWHTWSSYYFPHCMLLCTITYSVYYSALYTIKWMHFTFLPLFHIFLQNRKMEMAQDFCTILDVHVCWYCNHKGLYWWKTAYYCALFETCNRCSTRCSTASFFQISSSS